jgi:hypothetical protein
MSKTLKNWWGTDKNDNSLELISIHIPKTAGTSFRNTLKKVYGNKKVIRLDIELDKPRLKINEQLYSKRQLPKGIKAIHGHFSYPLLLEHFDDISKEIPIITWLRDPVERVISNYFYLSKRLKEELKEEEKGLNILPKMQRSLLEYAADELNQNRMAKHLEGLKLEDFLFIGLVEEYEKGLEQLGQLMGWERTPKFEYNKTGKNYADIPETTRAQIKRWNTADVALYEHAKALNAKHDGR